MPKRRHNSHQNWIFEFSGVVLSTPLAPTSAHSSWCHLMAWAFGSFWPNNFLNLINNSNNNNNINKRYYYSYSLAWSYQLYLHSNLYFFSSACSRTSIVTFTCFCSFFMMSFDDLGIWFILTTLNYITLLTSNSFSFAVESRAMFSIFTNWNSSYNSCSNLLLHTLTKILTL